jgi:hypothetical protein
MRFARASDRRVCRGKGGGMCPPCTGALAGPASFARYLEASVVGQHA